MKKKTGLNGYVYEFSVDYNVIDTRNIINTHKYLTKKQHKITFEIIFKMFMGLLTSIVNASKHTKFGSYVWNPATCNCKNGKYLASIIDNSAIMCNEIMESYDQETNFK